MTHANKEKFTYNTNLIDGKACFQIRIFLVVSLETIDNFWLNTAKNRNLEKQKYTPARAK